MQFIGLDLGTSFVKGAVLDLDRLILDHVRRVPFPEPLPGLPPLFCEVNPGRIVSQTRELIDALLPLAPQCSGIVVCSQMQGLILTTETGEPLSNYISWRDQRALLPHPSHDGSFYDVLAGRVTPEERQRTGSELRPSLPLSALFWLAEQNRLPRPDAIPASLPDFVLARLCNESGSNIEPTLASVHGALDLRTLEWDRAVHEKLGLRNLRWPTIRPSGQIVGYLKVGSRRIPCYTPVGDQPSALAGALLAPGELSINISTGSQVSLLARDLAFGPYQTRPFFDGYFLNLITHIPAGRSLALLVGLLSELAEVQGVELPDPWAVVARQVALVPATDLQVDLAFFPSACGERGTIANIREDNLTVGHLFRAAFRNMSENYYNCALRLSPDRGWHRLVFSGGLAQNPDLLHEIRSKFGSEYRQCPSQEDTLLGLLALALSFSGRAASVEQAIAILSERYQAGPAIPRS